MADSQNDSLQTQHEQALSELSSLGRVSHKLAMTDGGKPLEKVLSVLLPRLLHRVGNNHKRTLTLQSQQQQQQPNASKSDDAAMVELLLGAYKKIHLKLVEMMGHIMKRVRAEETCRLPCLAILQLLYQEENMKEDGEGQDASTSTSTSVATTTNKTKTLPVDPFTLNLSLAFLTLAVPRECTTPTEAKALLPGVLTLLGSHFAVVSGQTATTPPTAAAWNQFHQVSHLVLRIIEKLIRGGNTTDKALLKKKSSSMGSSNDADTDTDGNKSEEVKVDPMVLARGICSSNSPAGAALYELLLDALLYQPPPVLRPAAGASPALTTSTATPTTSSTTTPAASSSTPAPPPPPPGLSSAGHTRLLAGSIPIHHTTTTTPSSSSTPTSTTLKPWSQAYASPKLLRDLKLALLAFLSPHRRFAIFQSNHDNHEEDGIGTARTVALLAVSSGDAHPEVADMAVSQLKLILDARRRRVMAGTGPPSLSAESRSGSNCTNTNTRGEVQGGSSTAGRSTGSGISTLGHTPALTTALLSLVLGGYGAEAVCKAFPHAPTSIPSLGSTATFSSSSSSKWRRSAVPPKTACAILDFVSLKILQEEPQMFTHALHHEAKDGTSVALERACMIGSLAVATAKYYLLQTSATVATAGGVSSSMHMGSGKGNPTVAAAQLVNALCIRLIAHFDHHDNTLKGIEKHFMLEEGVQQVLGHAMSLACAVLAPSASSMGGVGGTAAFHQDARYACYGVVCTLARSSLVLQGGFLFDGGAGAGVATSTSTSTSTSTAATKVNRLAIASSTATAALLFGCVSHEEEVLRTRATAALDALLGAYCRVYQHAKEEQKRELKKRRIEQKEKEAELETAVNPWQQLSSENTSNAKVSPAAPKTTTTTTAKEMFTTPTQALLPLLWTAAQPSSQPKASRLAAATWCKDLISKINRAQACHLLCFLAGDEDAGTASVAREGLMLSRDGGKDGLGGSFDVSSSKEKDNMHPHEEEEDDDDTDKDEEQIYPEFNHMVRLLFTSPSTTTSSSFSSSSWRPTFDKGFSSHAKGAALQFALQCFLEDFYGGDEDEAVFLYVHAICTALEGLSANLGLPYLKPSVESSTSGGASGMALSPLHQGGGRNRSSHAVGRHAMDLLEDCAMCLAGCLGASSHTRKLLIQASLPLRRDAANEKSQPNSRATGLSVNLNGLASYAIYAPSSKARRYFASCCGLLYEDVSCWLQFTENHKKKDGTVETWLEQCGMAHVMEVCSGKLGGVGDATGVAGSANVSSSSNSSSSGQVAELHGAAYLGGSCVRALRLVSFTHQESLSKPKPQAEEKEAEEEVKHEKEPTQDTPQQEKQGLLSFCWQKTTVLLTDLAQGCLHSQDVVCHASAQSLSTALSYDSFDAPPLPSCLFQSVTSVLTLLSTAVKRYAGGDGMDATRASAVAQALGVALASSTWSTSGTNTTTNKSDKDSDMQRGGLGPARWEAIQALLELLGSLAYRKDEEIALVVGDALRKYADGYGPEGCVWSGPKGGWEKKEVEEEYVEGYAAELPPHDLVVYRLLKKDLQSNHPQKRTSCAPVLLALVAHAAWLAAKGPHQRQRPFVQTILSQLESIQLAFLKLLADPKSKQLARESCCLGLAACQGVASCMQQQSPSQPDAVDQNEKQDTLNTRLLKAFGQTTNFGGSALMETRAQEAARHRENATASTATTTATNTLQEFGLEENSGLPSVEEGGAAGMAEAALGAYREMASAALALDRPDVLYALMIMSVTHPAWTNPLYKHRFRASVLLGGGLGSRSSSSSGGGTHNVAELRRALKPHLAKLVPRLLRASNDPNKTTREQMNALWNSLSGGGAEGRALIAQHLLPTIDALMKDASSKLWRARVGACGALADVLVGRTWVELGGGGAVSMEEVQAAEMGGKSSAGVRLLRLWKVTTRAMDDVRLAVRESGEGLARTMRSLTVRLCDPLADVASSSSLSENGGVIPRRRCAESMEEEKAAASTALGWLVQYGLNQPCAEATGACVSCLLGVIEVAQPSTLEPVLPELIGSLAMAISGLEPAALNYLQVRASGNSTEANNAASTGGGGFERLERLRLQLAQSGPMNAALTKCLQMVRSVPLTCQRNVIPQLDHALRCGSGFATRSAAADAVTTLCSTCPEAFHFPSKASGATNPTVRLLRALYFASERERGVMARDKMAHALGSLAALAPPSSVRLLATKACHTYSQATGSNDDPAARRAAASALRAMAVRASLQFADGGPKDTWCRLVLPMACLGCHDEDAKVAGLWKDVWEEGGASVSATLRSTEGGGGGGEAGFLLQERLLPQIIHACVEALQDVSWSRRRSACACITALTNQNVLAPAPRSVGSSNSGAASSFSKAVDELTLHRARRRAQASCAILTTAMSILMKKRVYKGKDMLVQAVVQVAAKWNLQVDGHVDDEAMKECDMVGAYGWDGTNGNKVEGEQQQEGGTLPSKYDFPWIPVVSRRDYVDDLFLGDGWFGKNTSQEPIEDLVEEDDDNAKENEKSKTTSKDEIAQENEPLKFDNEDTLMEAEESSPAIANKTKAEEYSSTNMKTVTFQGICRILLDQAAIQSSSSSSLLSSADGLPYRASALQGLADLLQSTRSNSSQKRTLVSTKQRQRDEEDYYALDRGLYEILSPALIEVIEKNTQPGASKGTKHISVVPPLIVARALGCLAAAIYKDIGPTAITPTTTNSDTTPSPEGDKDESKRNLDNVSFLAQMIQQAGGSSQPAWTVREAAAMAGASVASKAVLSALWKHSVIDMFLSCVSHALKDRKFWKVRLAGLKLLYALVQRAGSSAAGGGGGGGASSAERQMMLESLLPSKEKILKLARGCLTDQEAQVTGAATDICSTISWWP